MIPAFSAVKAIPFSVAVKPVSSKTPIREGAMISISGQKLKAGQKILSVGIVSTNVKSSDIFNSSSIEVIYSSTVDTIIDKNGKFLINTPLISFSDSLKKGAYRMLVWAQDKSSKGEITYLSNESFTISGDSLLTNTSNSSFEYNPITAKAEATWSIKFTADKDKQLKAGDFMLIDYFSNGAATMSNTSAKISCNNKSTNIGISITSNKPSFGDMPSSVIKLVLKGDILLKAGKETAIQVSNIKNPSELGYGFNYEIDSKDGLPLVRSKFTNEPRIDIPSIPSDQDNLPPDFPSDQGNTQPPPSNAPTIPTIPLNNTPELNLIQFPPSTIALSVNKDSDPFTFVVGFKENNNLPGKVYADICDVNGDFLQDGNSMFSFGNGDASTQITVDVKDGKATFENITLKGIYSDKPIDKVIYIKIWIMTNPSIKPIIVKITNQ